MPEEHAPVSTPRERAKYFVFKSPGENKSSHIGGFEWPLAPKGLALGAPIKLSLYSPMALYRETGGYPPELHNFGQIDPFLSPAPP